MVKVSVIVPVYNTEKYIERCIESLLNQTLEEIEIILIDDGSKDSCPQILDQYQSKYPDKIIVIHKENGGQATARNLAFQHCRGEYIGFIDSDDYAKTDMFYKMYTKAVSTDADYVACGYMDYCYEDDKEVFLNSYVASKVAKEKKDLYIGALAPPWLHIYKRELILDNGIVFPEGVVYEDTAFYLNLIPYIEKIATVEEALVVRLRRKNSTMTSYSKNKVDDIFDVFKYSINFYKQHEFYEKYRMELEYFCVRVLLCSSMQRISFVKPYSDARELQKETLKFIREYYPEYKNNPYMKSGHLNLYLKSFNAVIAPIVLMFFRITNRFKRSYS